MTCKQKQNNCGNNLRQQNRRVTEGKKSWKIWTKLCFPSSGNGKMSSVTGTNIHEHKWRWFPVLGDSGTGERFCTILCKWPTLRQHACWYTDRPNPHWTHTHSTSKWDLLMWIGVSTLHASNIKGFAFEFADKPFWKKFHSCEQTGLQSAWTFVPAAFFCVGGGFLLGGRKWYQ